MKKSYESISYLIRCVAGVAICYLLYLKFPGYPLSWSIVSVALATSATNDTNLAFDRIKANLLGGFIGLCLYFIPAPDILLICTGVAATVLLGSFLKLETSLRTALAAVVIVFVKEENTKNWKVALERVGCVLVGCLVALGITLCFNLYKTVYKQKQP